MAKKSVHRDGSKTARESEPRATYFLSLQLQNIRCFGEQPQLLDLSDGENRPARWTILLGNNGTGKTTVLQMLSIFRIFLESERGHPQALQTYAWAHHEQDRNIIRACYESAEVLANVAIGPNFETPKKQHKQLRRGEHGIKFKPYMTSSTSTSGSPEPPICYAYGAGRRLGRSSLSESVTNDTTRSLFFEDTELRNAEEWLLRLDYSASKPSAIQQKQNEQLEQIKQLLIKILPEVDRIRFTAPTRNRPTPSVEFQTPYGWVPLRQLGYGYQTLIAWMVDFASRMGERYPDSPNPMAEPAVVLVDEIDLHLHPSWQRILIPYLTDLFPNTQFIATAHSPLIVQAATGANLALLRREGDHVVIDNDVEAIRGWRIDQILTSDLFGLPSARPPELDELLAQRRALLTKPKRSKADEKKLAEVELKIGVLPTGETADQAKTMALIERTLEVLQKRQDRSS